MKPKNQSEPDDITSAITPVYKESHFKKYLLLGSLVIGFFIIISAFILFTTSPSAAHYSSERLSITSSSQQGLKDQLVELSSSLNFTLKYQDKTVAATSEDLNLSLAIDENTIEKTSDAFNITQSWRANLLVNYNLEDIQSFLSQAFPDSFSETKNAGVAYDAATNLFYTTPAVSGRQTDTGILIENIKTALADKNTGKIIELATTASEPIVKDSATTVDYLNHRQSLRLNLNFNGRLIYYADPPDIASWVELTPNSATHQLDVTYNKSKIEEFLYTKVNPYIPAASSNRVVLVDSNGHETFVINPGHGGYSFGNVSADVEALYGAVTAGVNLDHNLNLTATSNYYTQKILESGERWIDVNLSAQTTSLFVGDTHLMTWYISSGRPETPTYPGTFYILRKVRVDYMPDAPGNHLVPWTSYFDTAGRAFHEAWWHNNFGNVMSHGCINMPSTGARTLYEFAPIGTRVEIHY